MLLNPNAVGREKGGRLENVVSDPFDMPVPGQSLTDTPGKWPWDSPPEITNVDDALTTVLLQLEQNPKVQKSYDQLITLGMPIESIVNTISFGGFVNGLWSVDIAELLKPPLQAALMLYADEKELTYKIFNDESDRMMTPADTLSTSDTMQTMKENNPEAFDNLSIALQQSADNMLMEKIDKEAMAGSFLVVSPENMEVEDE